jgi:hypothetical protein
MVILLNQGVQKAVNYEWVLRAVIEISFTPVTKDHDHCFQHSIIG